MTWCYVNGEFGGSDRLLLSVRDRGFRFGDGLFETIPYYHTIPYQWDWHMDRMRRGLHALRIVVPETDFLSIARDLMQRNLRETGFIRIAISRGVGSKGYMPRAAIEPTIVMEALERHEMPDTPAKLYVSTHIRPSHPSLLTRFKTAQGLNSTLAVMEAREKGFNDALLLNDAGEICETAAANIFWIVKDKLYTPSLETGCLEGSTRAAVLRLSPVPVEEVRTPLYELLASEGAFMTNCARGIWPVSTITGSQNHWTNVHPIILQISDLYRDDILRTCTASG